MATMMIPPEVASAPLNPDAEEWKISVRKQIEDYLLPQVNEAKASFQQKLSEAPVDEHTRDKLAKEHTDTLKNLRRIADDLYRDQIEQVRARLTQDGQLVVPIFSVDVVEQQRRIIEQIEKGKLERAISGASNFQSNMVSQSGQQPQWTPVDSPTSDRDGEYFSRQSAPLSASYVDDDRRTRRSRNGSGASGYDLRLSNERMGDYVRSQMVDEPEEIDRSGRPHLDGSGSFRRQSNTGPKPIPEFWIPSISPEETANMSRTTTLARRGSTTSIGSHSYRPSNNVQYADRPEPGLAKQGSISSIGPNSYRSSSTTQFSDRPEYRQVTRQGSVASIGSHYYRPPSTNQIPERPEPTYDSRHIDDIAARSERERSGIRAAEEEWSEMMKAWERGSKGDDRYRSSNGAIRPETAEHAGLPMSSRPIEIPQRSYPLAPANRSNGNDRSFSIEEAGRYGQSSSPHSQGWAGSTRTAESITSRSPSTTDGGRAQPPHPRQPVAAQDFQHERRPPVGRRQTFSKEAQTTDIDNIDRLKEEQQRQAELEANARRREEEAKRKEEEARRKEEEARRKEADAKRKEEEARQKEEEAKHLAEEARRKEEEAQRKEAEARRRAEEAERLEKEAKAKEAAARLKEEETRRKEAEIKRREEDLRRREQELERREAEAQRKEEEKRQRQLEESRKADMETRQAEKLAYEAKLKEDEELAEAIKLVEDMQRLESEDKEKHRLQQEVFRKREEEIRLRAYQRRSQEEYEFYSETPRPAPAKAPASHHSSAPRPIPNRNGSVGNVDHSGTSASSYTSSSGRPSFKTNATPASSIHSPTTSTNTKPTFSASRPTAPTPEELAEWTRRQDEHARLQQEAFAREQQQQEKKRAAEASKNVKRDDALKLLEAHERQWIDLPNMDHINWYNVPWPVFEAPKSPDGLDSANIAEYVTAQYNVLKPQKTMKDHIKEHLRRWHPDRFETRYLSKVLRGNKESVREGAGVVVRALNEMLTREQ